MSHEQRLEIILIVIAMALVWGAYMLTGVMKNLVRMLDRIFNVSAETNEIVKRIERK